MTATDPNARFWNRAARRYAASPIADMAGFERSLARCRDFIRPDHLVFEFGCGTGTAALALAPGCARLEATDISSEMIAIAQEKAAAEGIGNVAFQVGAPDESPFPDETFDVAIGFNILHLLPDRPAALEGVRRILKPGGLFISKTPCLKEMNFAIRLAVPVMRAVGKAPYVAFTGEQDLIEDITAAGFDIVKAERHGTRGQDVRPFIVARKA